MTDLNILIIGAGMYVTGRGSDSYGTIMPSIIDTPTNRQAMPIEDHSLWVKPHQIAQVVGFLISEQASIINGATIPVYGRA